MSELRPQSWIRQWLAAFAALIVIVGGAQTTNAQGFVARVKVRVQAPTRMDWLYVATGKSLAVQPEGLTKGYKSTAQRYNLYAPARQVVHESLPLVLFIPYRNNPMGWDLLRATCAREGVVYVEPHGAGNLTPGPTRIRIALDCLDDVRRRYNIDPDRTYVAGYSGGASIASRIAMSLPEHFGGLIAASMTIAPPTTPWPTDRIKNRLSICAIIGENDHNTFELHNVQSPIFNRFGFRMRCDVIPLLGHSPPPAIAFNNAFLWLEQDVAARREYASQRPALRMEQSPTRQQWAAIALKDAQTLLKDDPTVHIGLGLLHELASRWEELPEADEAQAIIADYDSRPDKPWAKLAREERLKRTETLAFVYDRVARARSGLPQGARSIYAKGAIDNYRILIDESDDPQLVAEATTRIGSLEKLVGRGRK